MEIVVSSAGNDRTDQSQEENVNHGANQLCSGTNFKGNVPVSIIEIVHAGFFIF